MAKVAPSTVKKVPPVKTTKTEHVKMRIPKINRVHQKPVKTWIEEHLKCRECNVFVKTPANQESEDPTCGCGYARSEHGADTPADSSKKWDYNYHTKIVDCNSYGRLNFVDEDGNQQPQFVKVGAEYEDTEKVKTVIKLFESRWSLPAPKLLISVTGGAKDFHVLPDLLSEFKKGLMKAVKSTDAWVITGGTNTGVMKLVGEAVRGYSGSNITSIGIASWGIIKNKEQLLKPTKRKEKKKLVFDYPTKASPAAFEAYMDPNHSHFLLVDDGSQKKYGTEISMRGAIEAAICEHYQDNYNIPDGDMCRLPMICILVEGGPNSISTCVATIRNGNPVLVLQGSGRSADIIAKAYSYSTCAVIYEGNRETKQRTLPDEYWDDVKMEINKHFLNMKEEARENIFKGLLELLKYDNLLTVYRLQGDKNNDFDNAILIAMIRSVSDHRAKMSQMMLAITWDRLQIAKDMILTRHSYQDHELEQFLRVAIIQNRTGFVKKLLDTEADMKHYLTYKELQSLYNTMDLKVQTIGKVLLTRAETKHDGVITLQLIGSFLEEIIEGFYRSPWAKAEFDYESICDEVIDCPYDIMVVFACIMQFHDMALLFWGRCKEPIVTGLIAAKINWHLSEFESNKLACDEDNAEMLSKQGFQFELMACSVMSECYRRFDRKDWTKILTAPRPMVNKMNLIQLAKNISADNFIAESPIQSYLNHTWMGQIHHSTSMLKILLCFIPPLFLLLRYNKRTMTSEEKQAWETVQQRKMMNKGGGIKSLIIQTELNRGEDTEEMDNLSLVPAPNRRKVYWNEAVIAYYTSPATKFTLHFITYFVFLAFYGYTLLVRPVKQGLVSNRCNITYYDIILCLWILGQIPSEWHQLMQQNPVTLGEKLRVHFRDVFNVLDIVGIATYLASFILKSVANRKDDLPVTGDLTLHNVAHIVSIIAFLLLGLRIIQVLEVSMKTGPKIIMIGKMMVDFVLFLFLIAIFLITYGICSQALQAPNDDVLTGFRLYNVILLPALNVFGEIGLEDMQASLIDGHCTQDDGCEDVGIGEFLEHDSIASTHYYFLQLLMFCYLLFVNVLLLNLLIAIFSSTYETVESEAAKIWKVQWCAVVVEFKHKQPLPNPFSLIWYMIFSVRWVVTQLQCKVCAPCIQEEEAAPDIDFYELHMKVSEARENYTQQKDEEDEEGDIRRSLKFIKDKLMISQLNTAQADLSMMRSMSVDQSEAQIRDIKHHSIHRDSRKSPYIGTDIQRSLLADRNVAWEVAFPYNPPDFTEPDVLKNVDKFSVDPSNSNNIIGAFNQIIDIDGDKVDRVSFCGNYQIVEGVPLNPRGRTGISGRGQLNRWGPNHSAEPIVTRWARDIHNEEIKLNGHPVMEFVGVFLKESRKWALPGGFIRHGEMLTTALKREFSEDALGGMDMESEEREHVRLMLKEHLSLGIAVYKGYVDDPRNTDNAWVESHAINYHDGLGTSFSKFPLRASVEGESLHAEWITLDRNIDLYGNHEWILEKVCFHRHAYNPFSTSAKKQLPVVAT
ncbi:transient receptor potential cation channel subfamily M member-like 2 isoform X2 [Bolinopsis microptera]|uniref:transient receptor potential cation channel subfamily M member-like 2 isoform X2 n=1 Tax=Bolinopsis microptera TaxID=2820187 RepID=UPI003078F1C4